MFQIKASLRITNEISVNTRRCVKYILHRQMILKSAVFISEVLRISALHCFLQRTRQKYNQASFITYLFAHMLCEKMYIVPILQSIIEI